jgi:hypothetical protein
LTYAGLTGVTPESAQHLGGNITVGDPFTYSPRVWDYVIDRFCITSALDLGSGCGNASFYMHKRGVRVVAVEGFKGNVDVSLYPAVQHDLTKGSVVTRVDLVHCQEVVEHIEEKYLGNILDTFAAGKYVLMTHALPGQGGYHHVNEQPQEYWVHHLEQRGFRLLSQDTDRIRAFAKQEDARYLAQSGLIFSNSARV